MPQTRKTVGGGSGDAAEDNRTPARRTPLAALVKYNVRSILQPKNLLLLLVAALITYFGILFTIPPTSSPYFYTGMRWEVGRLTSLYAGPQGLHPLFFAYTYYTQFTFFVIIGGPIMMYLSVCNLVAEDSGSLPKELLFSRPVSRGVFLVVGFASRFLIVVALSFVIPFVVGYAQIVSVIGRAVEPEITKYMTMGEWYSMAWNGFLWGYVALFVTCLFALTAIAALVAVASGRGLVTLSLITGLTFLLCAAGVVWMAAYVSWGGNLPFFFPLTPQYYLYGAILSTPGMINPVNNRLLTIDQGIPILVVYGCILMSLSVLLFRRRGAGEA